MSKKHSSEQPELFSENEQTKKCTKCKQVKPLGCFYKHGTGGKYLRPDCKECGEAAAKIRNAVPARRERNRAYHKRYNANLTPDQKERYEVTLTKYLKKSPRIALSINRNNALKRRPTDNPISLNELMELWEQQEGRCAISGIPMTWKTGGILPTSLSLDRIDGSRNYEPGNVRLVCYSVNAFRNTMSDAEMLSMARAIVANMTGENRQPLTFIA